MKMGKSLITRLSVLLPLLLWGFPTTIAFAQSDEANAISVKFTTLASFTGPNGLGATWPLVQASNGEFYGTTLGGGGSPGCGQIGCGTIFKITPSGALTTLYSFLCSPSGCMNGDSPTAALVQATNGDLYGTTPVGGTSNGGTIFKITPNGALTTLYSFCAQSGCPDGVAPFGEMVQASDGDLYGTAPGGASNAGTIFKITPNGALTTLYSFCAQSGCPDGEGPNGALIQATNGDLYGTTSHGGIHDSNPSCVPFGCGTVFKIAPTGTLTSLYSFCAQSGCPDGEQPLGGLVQAGNGDLYGTTSAGGIANSSCALGCGTIFKITSTGTLTTLYSFCSQTGCPDGNTPQAGLVQAASGNLYGTTSVGGAKGYGTVFKITPNGTLTTLYSFCSQAGCADGSNPNRLVQGTNGTFYGTTDGLGGYGTVFALSTGEAPFVETRPTIGKVGEIVTIVGYGLTGATSVKFNGTPATTILDKPTAILAKVPAGATSGKVEVTMPSRTLSSNKLFEVVP